MPTGKIYYRAARRLRNETGSSPGYEERISWIQGDLTFDHQYVRAVSHADDSGARAKTYDFVIPWQSILYIEMESEAQDAQPEV